MTSSDKQTVEHEHEWTPVPMECGRYACACGSTGWRCRDGRIIPHKQAHKFRARQTVRYRGQEMGHWTLGYWSRKLPTADEQALRWRPW